MGTLDQLIRDLQAFEGRKEVMRQLRKEIREPIPAVRTAIRRRALDTLPARGGLNVWASKTQVTATVSVTSRAARVRLKGSRKSTKDKSDIRRLDQGRVRHPSFGRRGKSQWHSQNVTAGFFTEPAAEADEWRDACQQALENAAVVITRG
ncbi:hypothetical protein [Micromonospora sp. C81]|uniref:hypothetical protein n=1 Tax=Micromonospora sp. C81 TaxID=2824881 RepID=UPI001B39924D|nr:hypothetical protein [Micromonospora sp. C81]MBQ1039288.1 hypothetical protein [Micromonospora sp. C81]